MCDFFWQRMDTDTDTTTTTNNNNADQGGGAVGGGGDLADIVRMVNASSAAPPPQSSTSWQLPENMPSTSFHHHHQQQQQQLMTDNNYVDGDSFDARDPLLHELTGTAFFECESAGEKEALDKTGTATSRPCNNLLFSRVLHISPAAATATAFSSKAPPPPLPIKSSLPMIVPGDSGLQISSPTTPGIKRRKNQAKKVVCIPAPASASSRPSGEVVPSDLWAWRKYGQKPIKGSPYPRGYYRCSSSKGCSARKQVERSRTDPNMLVITYTSEHNHPWPTQRNALAGSTRSQPSKIGALATSKKTPPPPPPIIQEPNKEPMSTTSPTNVGASTVKKEEEMTITTTTDDDHIFNQVFYNENPVSGDDFFAELAELDSDPMSLVFPRSPTTGIIGESVSRSGEEVVKEKEKLETSSGSKGGGLESFINMFDWGGMSSFGIGEINQPKKGL